MKNLKKLTLLMAFYSESGSEFQKEASQNEYSVDTEVGARKITEEWKTDIEVNYEINREN